MTSPFGDDFGGIADAMFGGSKAQRAEAAMKRASEKIAKESKPLPQLRRKTIDGEPYIRATDVAALLRVLGGDRAQALANKIAGTS